MSQAKTTEEKLVEALAVANAVITKQAAELEGMKKAAASVPASKDYGKEMEPRSDGILDLLARAPFEDFRFTGKDSPMRKEARAALQDPIKAVDTLMFTVGRLLESSGEGEAPKRLGKSAAVQSSKVDAMADPNHPDHSFFANLN